MQDMLRSSVCTTVDHCCLCAPQFREAVMKQETEIKEKQYFKTFWIKFIKFQIVNETLIPWTLTDLYSENYLLTDIHMYPFQKGDNISLAQYLFPHPSGPTRMNGCCVSISSHELK